MKDFNFNSDGLGEKGLEVLAIFEEYMKYKDDNEVVSKALLNSLKSYRDKELMAFTENEETTKDDIELYLLSKKKYQVTNKDLLKGAMDYMKEFIEDLDISFAAREKSGHIVLRKFIGMKTETFASTFLITENQAKTTEAKKFLSFFVDTYMKNHVKKWVTDYIESADINWLGTIYKPVETVNNWYSFDIEFEIPYEELTEEHMKELHQLIVNIEIYTKGLLL